MVWCGAVGSQAPAALWICTLCLRVLLGVSACTLRFCGPRGGSELQPTLSAHQRTLSACSCSMLQPAEFKVPNTLEASGRGGPGTSCPCPMRGRASATKCCQPGCTWERGWGVGADTRRELKHIATCSTSPCERHGSILHNSSVPRRCCYAIISAATETSGSVDVLQVLSVAYNALNGSLPAAWDLPRDLVELWLNNNKLAGEVGWAGFAPASTPSSQATASCSLC